MSPGGVTTRRNHVLRYCYFGPRQCSKSENGYETIRIGDSKSQAHDMGVRIEYNVFDRAIWRTDGAQANDLEIISNKSRGNFISHNTFLNSFGQITLRHGDQCVVDGNYIFGSGSYSADGKSIVLSANPNAHQGGVRVIGKKHEVKNNYFINLVGQDLRAALCVMMGQSNFVDGNGDGGSNGYEAADEAKIYNNTFIHCKQINLSYKKDGATVVPQLIQFYNNVWQGNGASKGIVLGGGFGAGQMKGSGGNYIYHPDEKYGSENVSSVISGTYTKTSPQITELFESFLIPTSSSPLIGKANSSLVAATDITGLSRTGSFDIGSFERGLSGEGYLPQLRNEVGPVFDGGPAGTYLADIPVPPPTPPTSPTDPQPPTPPPADETKLSIVNVLASSYDERNNCVPQNTIDGSFSTRWAASGEGEWIMFNLETVKNVQSMKIAWYKGALRRAKFNVKVSADGVVWSSLLTNQWSGGETDTLEKVELTDTNARFVKIEGYGNDLTDLKDRLWNSILEVQIFGKDAVAGNEQAAKFSIPGSAVTASAHDGHLPANTVDGSRSAESRWSAFGSDQTIQFDLGSLKNVQHMKIAWYKGALRRSNFDVEISSNGSNWSTLVANKWSGGETDTLEKVELPDTNGRYVRIRGHGNDMTAANDKGWNSILEVEIYGTTEK